MTVFVQIFCNANSKPDSNIGRETNLHLNFRAGLALMFGGVGTQPKTVTGVRL